MTDKRKQALHATLEKLMEKVESIPIGNIGRPEVGSITLRVSHHIASDGEPLGQIVLGSVRVSYKIFAQVDFD